MYDLPIAGKIAHEVLMLMDHLAPYVYNPCRLTLGLWTHKSRPISFTLCVDDFGIQYVGQENAKHLLNALRTRYTITVDWTGTLFLGITLKWNYKTRTVDL